MPAKAQKAAVDAFHLEIVAIYTRAQETVPVRTGRLRSSGRIYKTSGAAGGEGIEYTAPYAVIVHNKPGFSKGFQWLLKAFKTRVVGMNERIKSAVMKAIKS